MPEHTTLAGDETLLVVLVVDDSASDAELIVRVLQRAGWDVIHHRVDTAEGMRRALQEFQWNLLLVDYRMPRFSAFDALAIYREFGLDVPFLIVSGSIGDETAVAAMKAGVHDYFLKDRLARFPVAVQHELVEAENRRRKRGAEASMRRYAEELAIKNRELEQYAAKLRESNIELERFAYVASHDLSEPLRSIAAYCELLVRRYRAGSLNATDADQFIGYIDKGVDRMQDLIQGLLSYSRVAYSPDVASGVVDPAAVVQGVLSSLSKSITETGAKVSCGSLPAVRADAVQLSQILQNLISNAIKYHRAGVPPRVAVFCERSQDEAVFSVADNGIGIDPEHWSRIFVVFKRLHTQEAYPGLGLGLSVAKRLVERQGGRIWLKSKPGLGSIFYFTLPLAEGVPDSSSPIVQGPDTWVI